MRLSELFEAYKEMEYFGLTKNDIDDEGYVLVYHGTVEPTTNLKKGFLSSNKFLNKLLISALSFICQFL